MLKISEACIHLNTRVSRITIGDKRRWKVQSLATNPTPTQCATPEDEFDIVILTAPFASNGIDIDSHPSNLRLTTNVRPYVERHVTLFSTLHRLSPEYFNQPINTTVSGNIFTAPKGQPTPEEEDGYEIFSMTVAIRVPPPDSSNCIDELEYVYMIISSKSIPDDEIKRLLGHETHTKSPRGENDSHMHESLLPDLGVTWVHRQALPHAYPELASGTDPHPILDNIRIAPDLYYTAAAEEVLSSMEMGCRMGKNVAKRLCYSKWAARRGERIP